VVQRQREKIPFRLVSSGSYITYHLCSYDFFNEWFSKGRNKVYLKKSERRDITGLDTFLSMKTKTSIGERYI